MKKTLKMIGWSVLALFVVYTFYVLWKQSQPVPIVYELVAPALRDIKKQTVATGKIEPRRKIEIKPQITGVISENFVKPGDKLKMGQTIARIQVITDMSQLNQAQTKIESANIQLREAERQYNRTKGLYDKGVVSREECEQAETAFLSAREQLTAAKSELEIATKGMSSRSGKINTTIVTSTIDGMVLAVPVKEGSSVSATSMFSDGTTICTVADMSDIQFKGTIDETEVAQLRVGMPVNLVLGAMQKSRLAAVLELVSPEGVEKNGAIQFEVLATAQVTDGIEVRSGYSVNAEIILKEAKQVISIDETAVELENNQAFVYRLISNPEDLTNQEFERIPIEIGVSDGVYIQVLSGIEVGDRLRGLIKSAS